MQIIISGHGMDVTEALEQHTHKKLEHIEKLFGQWVQKIEIILHIKKNDQIAEATIHGPHIDIHAKATHDDMYVAIEHMIKKLEAQLATVKGKK